jgi:hypothetical protein
VYSAVAGVIEAMPENHATASTGVTGVNRSHQWTVEEPEEVSAMPPEGWVTEAMLVNHGTASAVSLNADRSHEDEQGGADGNHEGCKGSYRGHKDEQGGANRS